jgi:hypothetical protein
VNYQITITLGTDRPLTKAEVESLLHSIALNVREPVIALRDEDGLVVDTDYADWQPADIHIDMHRVSA